MARLVETVNTHRLWFKLHTVGEVGLEVVALVVVDEVGAAGSLQAEPMWYRQSNQKPG